MTFTIPFLQCIVTWYRNGAPSTYTDTRILYDNGTVEFRPLIAQVDVTAEGVEYHCVLSNAFVIVLTLLVELLFFNQLRIVSQHYVSSYVATL